MPLLDSNGTNRAVSFFQPRGSDGLGLKVPAVVDLHVCIFMPFSAGQAYWPAGRDRATFRALSTPATGSLSGPGRTRYPAVSAPRSCLVHVLTQGRNARQGNRVGHLDDGDGCQG